MIYILGGLDFDSRIVHKVMIDPVVLKHGILNTAENSCTGIILGLQVYYGQLCCVGDTRVDNDNSGRLQSSQSISQSGNPHIDAAAVAAHNRLFPSLEESEQNTSQ